MERAWDKEGILSESIIVCGEPYHMNGGTFVPKHIVFILTMVCSTLIAGVSSASPLTDYSPGSTAVDIKWFPALYMTDRYTTAIAELNGTDIANGKQENSEWGVTTGLGGNWAIQYRQFNPETEDFEDSGLLQKYGLRTQELNVLYKIDQSISAFAGWHQARYTYEAEIDANVTAQDKNVLQAGLIGTTQVASKTQLYGLVGVGEALVDCELGVSYAVAKALDLDLVYRYKQVGELVDTTFGTPYEDAVTIEGLGLGITYKF